MSRARAVELTILATVLGAQGVLFARPIHGATNYDEDVYLAATDALRHGQALGTQVFAAQFPGFYDLLRGLSYVTGLSVVGLRAGLLAVVALGTVGGWLVGRRLAGPLGGLLVAALLTIAPPLDLFGSQVIADTPCLSLMLLSLGVATLPGLLAAGAAGAIFGAAVSIKLTALTVLPAVAWFTARRALPALAGALAVVAAELAAHARALGALWASGVTYHRRAGSTPAVIPHPHRQILDQIPRTTPFFALSLIALVVAVVLARPVLGRVWPVWLWVGLSLAFLFVYKPIHYNHLIVFPFTLAVAAGTSLALTVDRIRVSRLRVAIIAAVGLAVAAGWVQQLHRVDQSRVAQPASTIAAAKALARLTPPTALIADDRPIISFLAHRRVVGPLVDLAELRFETGSLSDARVIRDMARADAVVISRTILTRPAVLTFVRRHFALRYHTGGVRIYVR